jgi:hypothetical protein
MEPEGSLQLLQEPSTFPYPEPDQSNQHHPILFLQDPAHYYKPTYVLVFLLVSFPCGHPSINLYAGLFSPIRATYSTKFNILDLLILIALDEEYKSRELVMHSPPSRQFIPLRSISFLQHPDFTYPQFLP